MEFVTADAFTPILDVFPTLISVSTVVSLLSSVTGLCIGAVFAWWGIRKISSMLMSAFQTGHLNI